MQNQDENSSNTPREAATAAVSAVAGAITGYGVVATTGMSAVGVMGSGAGIGAAAGPVGMVAGAVIGLACYGVYRVIKG